MKCEHVFNMMINNHSYIKKYVNAICNFIKHERFTPFQDNVIKPWHRSQVFKELIHGTYCLGERINRSCQLMKIPLRFEKHQQQLKTIVLLYILNIVEIKFTYTYKTQYTIKCKKFHYDYLKEEQAVKESITKLHIFNVLHKKVRNHIIYSSRLNAINQEYMTFTEYKRPSFNHVFDLMKIKKPTHTRYYDNKIDYHFKLETEILWE